MPTTTATQLSSLRPTPTAGADPEAERLLADGHALSDALGELIRVVQFRDRDRACCHGLSVTQCYALKGAANAEALTINHLAAYLYLNKSTASRVANGLVDKGLLRRERDPDDGRIVRLVTTKEGREVHARIEDELAGEYAELLEGFDAEFRPALLKLLRRLGRSFASRVDASGGSCCVVRS